MEVLAWFSELNELVDIFLLDDEEEKIQELIKFDEKQLDIIIFNLDKIIEQKLNFSINLYPCSLLLNENKIKTKLKIINKKVNESWLTFKIEILENYFWEQKKDVNEILDEIFKKYNKYNLSIDDLVFANNWNNFHIYDEISYEINKNENLNLKIFKVDISIMRNEDYKSIWNFLLKIFWNKNFDKKIVFEGIENEEHIKKIHNAIEMLPSNLQKKAYNNIFIQWYYYHKPVILE